MAMPYAHVDTSLRALAGQAEGFGRYAIGGVHGSVYHVTTLHGIISFALVFVYIGVRSSMLRFNVLRSVLRVVHFMYS